LREFQQAADDGVALRHGIAGGLKHVAALRNGRQPLFVVFLFTHFGYSGLESVLCTRTSRRSVASPVVSNWATSTPAAIAAAFSALTSKLCRPLTGLQMIEKSSPPTRRSPLARMRSRISFWIVRSSAVAFSASA